MLITDNDRTTIGVDQHYEHPAGNFGSDYPDNVSLQECMYSIVEGHDGSLIACGNDGANFDDYIVIKFTKPCSETLTLSDIDATDPVEGPWNLTTNTLITGVKKVRGKIIVNSGVTLTIQNATLSFSGVTPSGIIVKQGGILIIEDGSKLTNLCDRPWEGIWVYGTPLSPQVLNGSNHGTIYVRENSIIENAESGVYLGQIGTSVNNGGIIRAENSFFYNSRVNIDFPAFGGAAGLNISKIERCKFDCFLALHGTPTPSKGTLHHVALVETHGVDILGCEFSNTGSDALYSDNFRTNGIQCINATVMVDRAGPPPLILPPDYCSYNTGPKNQFYNLHKGINILDITFPVPNAPVNRENILMSSNFNNCRNSIVAISEGGKKVYRNYFQYNGILSADFNGNPIFSIQMEVANDEGYAYIDSNSIKYLVDYDWAPHSIGMELTNTALHSGNCYIYRNVTRNLNPLSTYTGSDRKIGFISEQENPRVLLKCNEYYGLNLDWHIKGTTTFLSQYDPLNTNMYFNDFSGAVTGNAWSVYSPSIAFTAYGKDDLPTPAKDPLSALGLVVTTPVPLVVAPSCPATSPCAVKKQVGTEPGDEYEALGPMMIMPEEPEAMEPVQQEINELVETLREQNIPLCNMDEFTKSRFIQLSEGSGQGARSAQGILYHCGWDMQTETTGDDEDKAEIPNVKSTIKPSMILFPNPANSDCQITVRDVQATHARIIIVNALGQQIMNTTIAPGEENLHLPTNSWTDGVYFATYVNEAGEQISIKFVVQH